MLAALFVTSAAGRAASGYRIARMRLPRRPAMSSDLPVGEILLLGAALMAGGALTGVLSGLFGVGGGGGIVPILYELFGVIGAAEERGSILRSE
jgi:uncharacterized membrane protein YfcA